MAWNQTVACGHVIDASENQKENHMLVLITFFIWRKRRLDLDQDELGGKAMIDHAWRLEPTTINCTSTKQPDAYPSTCIIVMVWNQIVAYGGIYSRHIANKRCLGQRYSF